MGLRHPLTAACLAVGLCTGVAAAAPFTPGNIVISQIGDADTPGTANASPVHLLEISLSDPDGTYVQDIALPTTASGLNHRFTLTSYFRDGHLKRSANGLFLTIAGYDASLDPQDVTHVEPNEAPAAVVPRVIARLDPFGIVDTSTALTDAYELLNSTGGIHCAVSSDGRNFWFAGRGSGPGNRRVTYAAYGATTSTMLNTLNDPRSVDIFNGQLYAVYNPSGARGVHTIGTGLPTTSGQSTVIVQAVRLGVNGSLGSSPYDHYWRDADTVYLTNDDPPVTNGGGIQKFTRDTVPESPTFGQLIYRYTMSVGLRPAPVQAIKTMTGRPYAENPAHTELFAITAEDQNSDPLNPGHNYQNRLMRIVDTGCPTATTPGCSAADTFTTLQTSPAGTDFRGVALAPRACEGDECIGQCCLSEGCQDTTLAQCQALQGTWRGLGTTCSSDPCPLVCPTPFGDTDGDGDVDFDDYGSFQRCYAGPGVQVGGLCRCFDRPEEGFPTGDGDVDATDLTAFQACAGGANQPPGTCN